MDISRADLGLLLSLDVLLDECHVSRAATRLGISQPALSAQLARLREMFEDDLLVPSGRRMLPTPRAQALRAKLHVMLETLQDLVRERQSFDPATDPATFRISATDYTHSTFPLAATLATSAPRLRLALLQLDAQRCWAQMEAGEIDLLIGAERLMPATASVQPIFDERFVFIQRPGHPRGAAPITLDEFCALDHILVSPDGGGFVGATDLALARQGRTRNVRTSLSSFMLIPPLIQDSNLVAVIPARLAASWSHLVEAYAPPLDIPNFTVCMSWHPRRQNDPAHLWLRNQVAALA